MHIVILLVYFILVNKLFNKYNIIYNLIYFNSEFLVILQTY